MRRRGLHISISTLYLALLAGILTACSSGVLPKKSNGNIPLNAASLIKIATDLPVSRFEGENGQAVEHGVRLAVEEANRNNFLPGYTFLFDGQNDDDANGSPNPAIGAENVTSLIDDAQVAGIIGPSDSVVAKDELPLTNQAALVQIIPTSTTACLTQDMANTECGGPRDLLPTLRPTNKITYFRMAASNTDQGAAGADYSYKILRYRTAFVVNDATLDGADLASTFTKEYQADGGTLLGRATLTGTTNDSHALAKIALLKPAIVYLAGENEYTDLSICKQLEHLSTAGSIPLMGSDVLTSRTFATALAASGAPIYGTIAVADASKNPAASSFVSAYERDYGPLGAYSASGYDSAKILLNAIKDAIQTGSKVPVNTGDVDTAKAFRQAVINQVALTGYSGVTGQQSFDINGDTTNKTVAFYRVGKLNGSPTWEYVTEHMLSS